MPSWINKVKDALHLNRGNKHLKNKPKAIASQNENVFHNSIHSSRGLGIFIGENPSEYEGYSAAASGECVICSGRLQIPAPEPHTTSGIGLGAPYLPSREWNDTNSLDSSPTNRLDPRVDPASFSSYENSPRNFETTHFNNNKLEDAEPHQNKSLDRLSPRINTCKLLPKAVKISLRRLRILKEACDYCFTFKRSPENFSGYFRQLGLK